MTNATDSWPAAVAGASYDDNDRVRMLPEANKRAGRTPFQRDRARVLHSSALRRLAAKTQVHVAFENDFPRTRLTHSLECAQVGRELGAALGADPDLIEAACLAHDLGHPPFGHNGEAALDEAAQACGGFEGNAQSLRILSRLEVKAVGEDAPLAPFRSAGLNLTRATLDATIKYPWVRRPDRRKFGVYADDVAVFAWVRDGREQQGKSFEAQVMDWADDVAYSVHDLEDAVHGQAFDLRVLTDPDERQALVTMCADRYAGGADHADLQAALDRMLALEGWPQTFDGGMRALAGIKNLTSQLIGRFCTAAEDATRAAFGDAPLLRYRADLMVPEDARLECAVLKAVTARYVMEREGTEERYARERELVTQLVSAVYERAPETLDPLFAEWFAVAEDDSARLRVVIDQVASLTDTSASAWHRELVGR